MFLGLTTATLGSAKAALPRFVAPLIVLLALAAGTGVRAATYTYSGTVQVDDSTASFSTSDVIEFYAVEAITLTGVNVETVRFLNFSSMPEVNVTNIQARNVLVMPGMSAGSFTMRNSSTDNGGLSFTGVSGTARVLLEDNDLRITVNEPLAASEFSGSATFTVRNCNLTANNRFMEAIQLKDFNESSSATFTGGYYSINHGRTTALNAATLVTVKRAVFTNVDFYLWGTGSLTMFHPQFVSSSALTANESLIVSNCRIRVQSSSSSSTVLQYGSSSSGRLGSVAKLIDNTIDLSCHSSYVNSVATAYIAQPGMVEVMRNTIAYTIMFYGISLLPSISSTTTPYHVHFVNNTMTATRRYDKVIWINDVTSSSTSSLAACMILVEGNTMAMTENPTYSSSITDGTFTVIKTYNGLAPNSYVSLSSNNITAWSTQQRSGWGLGMISIGTSTREKLIRGATTVLNINNNLIYQRFKSNSGTSTTSRIFLGATVRENATVNIMGNRMWAADLALPTMEFVGVPRYVFTFGTVNIVNNWVNLTGSGNTQYNGPGMLRMVQFSASVSTPNDYRTQQGIYNVTGNTFIMHVAGRPIAVSLGSIMYSLFVFSHNTIDVRGYWSAVGIQIPGGAYMVGWSHIVGNKINASASNGYDVQALYLSNYDGYSSYGVRIADNELTTYRAPLPSSVIYPSYYGVVAIVPDDTRFNITNNRLHSVVVGEPTVRPDGVNFYGNVHGSYPFYFSGNVLTAALANGTADWYTVGFHYTYTHAYKKTSMAAYFSNNVVNAMRFANSTSRDNPWQWSSECDYLNGTLVTAADLMRPADNPMSVATCTAPTPSFPPIASPMVLPTPVPMWIPTPVPTPAPPQPSTLPSFYTPTAPNVTTQSGFTNTSVVLEDPVDVTLSDCTISELRIGGTISGARITIRNCTISQYAIFYGAIESGSVITFDNVTGYNWQLTGMVTGGSVVSIQNSYLYRYSATPFLWTNSIVGDGSKVQFWNCQVSGRPTTGNEYATLAYVHGMEHGGEFKVYGVNFTSDLGRYVYFVQVQSPCFRCQLTFAENTISMSAERYSAWLLYFSNSIGAGTVLMENNQLSVRMRVSSSSYNLRLIYNQNQNNGDNGKLTPVAIIRNNTVNHTMFGQVYGYFEDSSRYINVTIAGNRFNALSMSRSCQMRPAYLNPSKSVNLALVDNVFDTVYRATTEIMNPVTLRQYVWDHMNLTIRGNKVMAYQPLWSSVPRSMYVNLRTNTWHGSTSGQSGFLKYLTFFSPADGLIDFSDNVIDSLDAAWRNSFAIIDLRYNSMNGTVVRVVNNTVKASYQISSTGTRIRLFDLPSVANGSSVVAHGNRIHLTYYSGVRMYPVYFGYQSLSTTSSTSYLKWYTQPATIHCTDNVIVLNRTDDDPSRAWYGYEYPLYFGSVQESTMINVSGNSLTGHNLKRQGNAIYFNYPPKFGNGTLFVNGNTIRMTYTRFVDTVVDDVPALYVRDAYNGYMGTFRKVLFSLQDNDVEVVRPGRNESYTPQYAVMVFEMIEARQVVIARNRLVTRMTTSSIFNPDAFQFLPNSINPVSASTIDFHANNGTLVNADGTAGVYTVFLNMDRAGNYFRQPLTSEGNIANAMIFFNTTTLFPSNGITSQCDYLNGARVTSIMNGTVRACTSPAPPLPIVPQQNVWPQTPIPAWIPTPMPTPAPPTLSPSSTTTGNIVGDGNFTGSTSVWTVYMPHHVMLSDCSITSLTFFGEVNSSTRVSVRNCYIRYMDINLHIEQGAQFLFEGCTFGDKGSSAYSNLPVRVWGRIDGTGSALTFRSTMFRRSRTQLTLIFMENFVSNHGALTFDNVTVDAQLASSYCCTTWVLISLHGIISNGVVMMHNSDVTVKAAYGHRLFYVKGQMDHGRLVLNRNNILTMAYDRTSTDVQLPANTVNSTVQFTDNVVRYSNAFTSYRTEVYYTINVQGSISSQSTLFRRDLSTTFNVSGNTYNLTKGGQNYMLYFSMGYVYGVTAHVSGNVISLGTLPPGNSASNRPALQAVWASTNVFRSSFTVNNNVVRQVRGYSMDACTLAWLPLHNSSFTGVGNSITTINSLSNINGVFNSNGQVEWSTTYIANNRLDLAGVYSDVIVIGPQARKSSYTFRNNWLNLTASVNYGHTGIQVQGANGGSQVVIDGNWMQVQNVPSATSRTAATGMRLSLNHVSNSPNNSVVVKNNWVNVTLHNEGYAYGVRQTTNQYLNMTVTNNTFIASGAQSTYSALFLPKYDNGWSYSRIDGNRFWTMIRNTTRYPVPGTSYSVSLGTGTVTTSGVFTYIFTNNDLTLARPMPPMWHQRLQMSVLRLPFTAAHNYTFVGNKFAAVVTGGVVDGGYMPDGVFIFGNRPPVASLTFARNTFTARGDSSENLFLTVAVSVQLQSASPTRNVQFAFSDNAANAMKFFNYSLPLRYSMQNLVVSSRCDFLNSQPLAVLPNNGTITACSGPAPSLPVLPSGPAVVPTPVPYWVPTPQPTPAPPTLPPDAPTTSGFYSGNVTFTSSRTTVVIGNPENVQLTNCAITTLHIQGTIIGAKINITNCNIRTVYVNDPMSGSVFTYSGGTIGRSSYTSTPYGVFFYGDIGDMSRVTFNNVKVYAVVYHSSRQYTSGGVTLTALHFAATVAGGSNVVIQGCDGQLIDPYARARRGSSLVGLRQLIGGSNFTMRNNTFTIAKAYANAMVWVEHPTQRGTITLDNNTFTVRSTGSSYSPNAWVLNMTSVVLDAGISVLVTRNVMNIRAGQSYLFAAGVELGGVTGASTQLVFTHNRIINMQACWVYAVRVTNVSAGGMVNASYNTLELWSSSYSTFVHVWHFEAATIGIMNNTIGTYQPWQSTRTVQSFKFITARMPMNMATLMITDNWMQMRVTELEIADIGTVSYHLPRSTNSWAFDVANRSAVHILRNTMHIQGSFTSSLAVLQIYSVVNQSTLVVEGNNITNPNSVSDSNSRSFIVLPPVIANASSVYVGKNTILCTGLAPAYAIQFFSGVAGAAGYLPSLGSSLTIAENKINITSTTNTNRYPGSGGIATISSNVYGVYPTLEVRGNDVFVASRYAGNAAVRLPRLYTDNANQVYTVSANTIRFVMLDGSIRNGNMGGFALHVPMSYPWAGLSLRTTTTVTNNVLSTVRPRCTLPNLWTLAVAYVDASRNTTVDFSSNTLTDYVSSVEGTRYRADGLRLLGNSNNEQPVTATIRNNVFTAQNATDAGGWVPAFLALAIHSESLSSRMQLAMSGNVGNAMKFFNTSSLNTQSITSQCDYLNSQRVTSLWNATILACSDPQPSLPPLPSGAAVVATPVPPWIPTPVPTPAPPTLHPAAPSAEYQGTVSLDDFTDSTLTINDPTTVLLSNCQITTLWITGEVDQATINVRNCRISTVLINAQVTRSTINFQWCTIGYGTTTYTSLGSAITVFGAVSQSSTLTFDYSTVQAYLVSSVPTIVALKNGIDSAATVTFKNSRVTNSRSSGNYFGFATIFEIIGGGSFVVQNCSVSNSYYNYGFFVRVERRLASSGSLIVRDSEVAFSGYRYATQVVQAYAVQEGATISIDNCSITVTMSRYTSSSTRLTVIQLQSTPAASQSMTTLSLTRSKMTIRSYYAHIITSQSITSYAGARILMRDNWMDFGASRYCYMATGSSVANRALVNITGNNVTNSNGNGIFYGWQTNTYATNQTTFVMNNNMIGGVFYQLLLLSMGGVSPRSRTSAVSVLQGSKVYVNGNTIRQQSSSTTYGTLVSLYGVEGVFQFNNNVIDIRIRSTLTVVQFYANVNNGGAVDVKDNTFQLSATSSYYAYIVLMQQPSYLDSYSYSSTGMITIQRNTLATSGSYSFRPILVEGSTNDVATVLIDSNVINVPLARQHVLRLPTPPVRSGATLTVSNNIIRTRMYTFLTPFMRQTAWSRTPSSSSSINPRMIVMGNTFEITLSGTSFIDPSPYSVDAIMELYTRPAKYTTFESNRIQLTFLSSTWYTPSAVLFNGGSSSGTRNLTITGNTATLTYANSSAGVFTVAFDSLYVRGRIDLSNNMVNAMMLYNSSSYAQDRPTITSRCDYVNGQRATTVSNGTVLACSAPAPSLPPFPTGLATAVPTPAPWWIPTPVPTPVPPTLAPSSSFTPDATGSVTRTDFSVTNYVVRDAATVTLSDCTINTLTFIGSMSGATVRINDCNIMFLEVNTHVESSTTLTFNGGRLGSTSTRNRYFAQFYGSINASATVTFTNMAVYGSASTSYSYGVNFLAPIFNSGSVIFSEVTFNYQVVSSSYDYSAMISAYGIGQNGLLRVIRSTITVNGRDSTRFIRIAGSVSAGGRVHMADNNVNIGTDRYSFAIVYFDNSGPQNLVSNINSGGIVNVSSNTMMYTRDYSSYNAELYLVSSGNTQGSGSQVIVWNNTITTESTVYLVASQIHQAGSSVTISRNSITQRRSYSSVYCYALNQNGYASVAATLTVSNNTLACYYTRVVRLDEALTGGSRAMIVGNLVSKPSSLSTNNAQLLELGRYTNSSASAYYVAVHDSVLTITDNTINAVRTTTFAIELEGGVHDGQVMIARNTFVMSIYTSYNFAFVQLCNHVTRSRSVGSATTASSLTMANNVIGVRGEYRTYQYMSTAVDMTTCWSGAYGSSIMPGSFSMTSNRFTSAGYRSGRYRSTTVNIVDLENLFANGIVRDNTIIGNGAVYLTGINVYQSSSTSSSHNATLDISSNMITVNGGPYAYGMQIQQLYRSTVSINNNAITAGRAPAYTSPGPRPYGIYSHSQVSYTSLTIHANSIAVADSSINSYADLFGIIAQCSLVVSTATITMNSVTFAGYADDITGIALPYASSSGNATINVAQNHIHTYVARGDNIVGITAWSTFGYSRSGTQYGTKFMNVSGNVMNFTCMKGSPVPSGPSPSEPGMHTETASSSRATPPPTSAPATVTTFSRAFRTQCDSAVGIGLYSTVRNAAAIVSGNSIDVRDYTQSMGGTMSTITAATMTFERNVIMTSSRSDLSSSLGVVVGNYVSSGGRVTIQRNTLSLVSETVLGIVTEGTNGAASIFLMNNELSITAHNRTIAMITDGYVRSSGVVNIRGNSVQFALTRTSDQSGAFGFEHVNSGATVTVADNVVAASPAIQFVMHIEDYVNAGASFKTRSNSVDARTYIGAYDAQFYVNSTCDRLRGSAATTNYTSGSRTVRLAGCGGAVQRNAVKFAVDTKGGKFDPNQFAINLEKKLGLPPGSIVVTDDSGTGGESGTVTIEFADANAKNTAMQMSEDDKSDLGITSLGAADEGSDDSGGDSGSAVGIGIGVVVGILVVGAVIGFIVMQKKKAAEGTGQRTGMYEEQAEPMLATPAVEQPHTMTQPQGQPMYAQQPPPQQPGYGQPPQPGYAPQPGYGQQPAYTQQAQPYPSHPQTAQRGDGLDEFL